MSVFTHVTYSEIIITVIRSIIQKAKEIDREPADELTDSQGTHSSKPKFKIIVQIGKHCMV